MDMPPKTSRPASAEEDEEIRIGWRMAGIGMQVASEVAAGAILGYLFDLWRSVGHVGVLVGSIIGIAVGLWSLIGQTLKLNRQMDRLAPTKGRGTPLPPPDDDDDDDDDRWNDERR